MGLGVENPTPRECHISTNPLSSIVPHKRTTGPYHPQANSIAKGKILENFDLTCENLLFNL